MLTDLTLRLGVALAPPPEGAPDSGGATMVMVLFYIGLFFVFYFLLIRPQTKRSRELADMQGALQKGDSVVTSGGLYGSVYKVKDEIVTLQIAENVRVKVQKSAITTRLKEADLQKLDE